MAEHSLYGKRRLCYIEALDFTDIQGNGNDPLYKRFDSVNSVLKAAIESRYRSFLSHPLYSQSDDQVNWYVEEWKNTPKQYVELNSDEKSIYEPIKSATISHYRNALNKLSGEDFQILSRALKYIEDEFIYCYDGKVVLAIWGMTVDRYKHDTLGSIVHKEDLEKRFKVNFDSGTHGELRSKVDKVISRKEGFVLSAIDIPAVVANDGYSFAGWTPNPIDFKVTGDATFVAEYSVVRAAEPEKKYTAVQFAADENCSLSGTTTIEVELGHVLTQAEIPSVYPYTGYQFEAWSPFIGNPITQSTEFVAECGRAKTHYVDFNPGDFGSIQGNTSHFIPNGESLNLADIPLVEPHKGYRFVGWDKSPLNYTHYGDSTFTAQYEKELEEIITPEPRLPWYKRIFPFSLFAGRGPWGCLKWLLYLLLFLLLLWLILFLFRSCDNGHGIVPADTITTADGRVIDDNGRAHSIIDDNGNLPDNSIVAPIIGPDEKTAPITENPGAPSVVANRLNIFFEDDNADLNQFAKKFKVAYPGDEYAIIGYDNNVKMIQIQIPENERGQIRDEINSKIPDIKFFVVDESIFELSGDASNSGTDAGWHLGAINLKQGWRFTKGSSDVVVAVVDDGFDYKHDMLKGKIVKPYNVFTQKNRLSSGVGHGTHVAGLAVGSDAFYKNGASGVAPGCKLMPIQVFDNGICTFSSITCGIMYAIHEGADVVNVSIGPSFKGLSVLPIATQEEIARSRFKNEERVWRKIISIANKNNTILVFAVGNDNVLASMPPENRTNNTINVAAVDKNFSATEFSNFGSGSNISAPGKDIYSSFPVNSFKFFDGTSMSAPIVTGAIALMKSLKKDITASQVLGVLRATGRAVNGNIPPMVQVDLALQAVKSGKLPAGTINPVAGQPPVGAEKGATPEKPVAQGDDYSNIRKMIEEYKRKISELEKQLPENRK